MVGSVITTAAYIATSFASNILIFFLTHVVISAIGVSFMTMGAIVVVQQYFDKHKALAVGLMMTGYSIGYFIWPPFVTVLFSHYGWRGAFMIMAGLQLNICVIGAFMRPLRENKAEQRDQSVRHFKDEETKDTRHSSIGRTLMTQGRVFQNRSFMMFAILQSFTYLGYTFVNAYSPTMAKLIGESDTKGALLVSIFGT